MRHSHRRIHADGDLDLFICNGWQTLVQLFMNDGSGGFTLGGDFPHSSGACWPEFADLDGDSDLDLILFGIHTATASGVFLNDGSGGFSPSSALPADPHALHQFGDKTRVSAVGDLDGDGDIDIFICKSTSGGGASNSPAILLNDGSGGFSFGDSFGGLESTSSAACLTSNQVKSSTARP